MKKHWCLILILSMTVLSIQCVIEKDNHTFIPLEQLQNTYSQIDMPSEFKEVDSNSSTRKQSSLTSHFYKSSLTYSEVKDYFNTSLLSKGWIYGNEEQFEYITGDERRKRLSYKKEGCVLWIEYIGFSPTNNWNYGLSLVC